MIDRRIGFIGAGNMARSLVGGLLQAGCDGSLLKASDPDPDRLQVIQEEDGITVTTSNADVAGWADVVVLAVKPQVMQEALASVADILLARRPLLVSIAAGIRIASIQRWCGADMAVVRVMPNTPALVRSGASALVASHLVDEPGRNVAESVMRAVGAVVWLEDEEQMDIVTGLSGSGPAYFFYLMECLEAAATARGLDPAAARLLTLETALGAARLALESEESPSQLRRRVTSPGGTTERAIAVLDQGHVCETVGRALGAASDRSAELAVELGNDR